MSLCRELSVKKSAIILVSGVLSFAPLVHAGGESGAAPRKNTDVQVSSSDLEPFSIDKKTDPDGGKPVFYSDGSTTVGFNDDGEPNVGTRF